VEPSGPAIEPGKQMTSGPEGTPWSSRALEGTRTPNLLIRRTRSTVRERPPDVWRSSSLPELSSWRTTEVRSVHAGLLTKTLTVCLRVLFKTKNPITGALNQMSSGTLIKVNCAASPSISSYQQVNRLHGTWSKKSSVIQ
jgi:hypothetical protein